MPVARAIADRKRRARTGCLTCRRRRRKCDEQKPRCSNCEAKSFSCQYPALTFVSSVPDNELGDASDDPRQRATSYSSITFVDEQVATPASKSGDSETRNHHSPEVAANDGGRIDNSIDAVLNSVPVNAESMPRRPRRDLETHGDECPLSYWDSYFSTTRVSPNRKEAALFRHFGYNIVPWIVAGDPASQFGVDIMRLGQESTPIHAAILAISSRQLQLVSEWNQDREEDTLLYQQEARNGLPNLHAERRRAGEALMALEAFLSSSPSQWGNIPLFDLKKVSSDGSVHSVEEPLKTLYQLHARIDLAASLLTGRPPLTSPAFHSSYTNPISTSNSSAREVYNKSLHHLTIVLHFIHGDAQSLQFPSFNQPDPTLSSFTAPTTFSSRWLSLWADCQTWYESRTPTMRPLLDIRSVEAGQIDPEDRSSFPIQIYTTAIALQASIAYHTASLLLLSQRPRLVKLPSHQRYVASQGWHAQNIAGIATKNSFAEQWDPILIAAILMVAKEMTHASQQTMLLACFADIAARTGIKLDQEILELQSSWNTARFYERSFV